MLLSKVIIDKKQNRKYEILYDPQTGNEVKRIDLGEVIIKDEYVIDLSIDKSIITADGTDKATITVSLLKNGEICTEFDSQSWFVPIVDISGQVVDLEEVILTKGSYTYEFSTTKPGIYTIRLDYIRPRTTAKLSENIEIIAKKP